MFILVEIGEEDSIIPETVILNHNASLNLMTPDAFSSPAKKDGDSKSTSPHVVNVETINVSMAQNDPMISNEQPLMKNKEQAPPSGGSSPSREVREILSLTELEENDQDVKEEPVINTGEDWAQVPMCKLTSKYIDIG